MRTKPFEIPSILESYRNDVASGALTIEQAALELYRAGWMCFNAADAKRLLEIKKLMVRCANGARQKVY